MKMNLRHERIFIKQLENKKNRHKIAAKVVKTDMADRKIKIKCKSENINENKRQQKSLSDRNITNIAKITFTLFNYLFCGKCRVPR